MAKAGKWKISRHNFTMSRQNPKATCKSLSQQEKLCRNKDKAKCKMTVKRLLRHFTIMLRHCMRRASEEAPEFCHDMERNITTKLRMEGQKNVATFDNSIATKNRANGKKTLSRRLKLCRNRMKREINEDTLKQCRDIETDCCDIENCKRKKLCHDTRELSHNIS